MRNNPSAQTQEQTQRHIHTQTWKETQFERGGGASPPSPVNTKMTPRWSRWGSLGTGCTDICIAEAGDNRADPSAWQCLGLDEGPWGPQRRTGWGAPLSGAGAGGGRGGPRRSGGRAGPPPQRRSGRRTASPAAAPPGPAGEGETEAHLRRGCCMCTACACVYVYYVYVYAMCVCALMCVCVSTCACAGRCVGACRAVFVCLNVINQRRDTLPINACHLRTGAWTCLNNVLTLFLWHCHPSKSLTAF